jgi:hypothetical protein
MRPKRTLEELPKTLDSAINDAYNVIDIGEHHPMANPKKSENDPSRSAKHKCVECKKDTSFMRSNDVCKTRVVNHKGKECYGTPICNPTAGARVLYAHGGVANTLTCLQIHRDKIRAAKHDEYNSIAARRVANDIR